MSTVWSKEIQSSEILYYSRASRFNDFNKDEWFNLLQIKDGFKVLEVGCGPGHFTNMIKKYYPNCEVYGVDLDENHIAFAKEKAKELGIEINYMTGDATSLPFENESFDIIFSHTLVEHLPFDQFISEQKRLLKNNGKLVSIHVDSKRKHINPFEYKKEEFDAIYDQLQFEESKHNVGQYVKATDKYLAEFLKFGMKNPYVQFKEIMFYFPFQAKSKNEAIMQIKHQEISEIANEEFTLQMARNGEDFRDKLLSLVQEKYAERMRLYLENQNIFDYESTAIVVYTATK